MIYTRIEKSAAVLLYAETKSIIATKRRFRLKFVKTPPRRNSILSWVRKFQEEGSLERKTYFKNRDNPDYLERLLNVQDVLFQNNNQISIRKMANVLHISKSEVQRCLRILKLTPYKIHIFQKLKERDFEKRLLMCESLLDLFRQHPDTKLIMSDEAAFHLTGKVNKHNCRVWGTENPKCFKEYERDTPKVNVWCAVSKEKIYGPFFFAEKTISGTVYTDMLEIFFYPQLEQENILNVIYFQQDGAPPHFSLIARESVRRTFGPKWIGRSGPIEWPANSPDLTVPDFYLWGYVKDRCYNPIPHNLEELKNNITNVIREINVNVLENCFRNLLLRFQKCIDQQGEHIQQFFL